MASDYSRLRPLGPRVLVQREPLVRDSREGLYLIGIDYPTIGKVLAYGPGYRRRNGEYRSLDLRIGDTVQWSVTSNFDLYNLGNDLLLLHYNDLNLVQRED